MRNAYAAHGSGPPLPLGKHWMSHVQPVLTHTFQPDGDRTRYTRRVRFETRGLLRILAPLMARINNPNRRWAENLKKILEK